MRQKPIHPAMQPYLDGKVILLDKPLGWTSFDAVKKIRVLTGVSKVGHAGTLDPLATGLLIICTGAFTKKINEYMAQEKEYTGSITLGATTPTYDLESEPENIKDISSITEQDILDSTNKFKGEIFQIPPVHSAIKQNGKPAYLAARRGEDIKLEPRKIFIREFEITETELPKVYFRVACTTGTYIRTLANDFGQVLGVGGHLSALCRTKIGNFSVSDAYSIGSFTEEINRLKQKHI